MKKVLSLVIVVIISSVALFAQLPTGIKYQAVARDQSGAILVDQSVNLRLSILDGPGGNPEYVEAFKIGTNKFGLFSVTISQGVPLLGDYSLVTWANGNKYLKVEFDQTGGSNYAIMGESRLQAVPYAIYAKNVDVQYLADTSATNEIISSVSFDPATNELTVTEAGFDFITTIDYKADDLTDNLLSDLGDVTINTPPTANQILKWNGVEWIVADDETNNQLIAIINNVLNITDGNSVDLSPYLDNTDDQQLGYDPTTNTLVLQNGGAVDLTDLVIDAYNNTFTFDPSNDELTINDGGGNKTVDLSDLVDDADADPTNEHNSSFSFNALTSELTIVDSGNSFTVDLTQLSSAAFNTGLTFNPNTMELTVTDDGTTYTVDLTQLSSAAFNTNLSFNTNTNEITVTDAGSSFTADLTGLIDDADADPVNEVNTNISFDPNTNEITITDVGGALSVDLSDLSDDAYNINASFDPNTNDLSITDNGGTLNVNLSNLSADAYNTAFSFNGLSKELTITDNGTSYTVDLTALVNDADADPTNEIQALSYDNNSGILSLSGSGQTVNLSGLNGTDNQDLGSSVLGTNVTLSITNGAGTSFSIADNDNDPVNELQTIGLSGLTVTLSDGGGSFSIADNDNNPVNELQTIGLSGLNVTLSDGGGSFSIADNDNNPSNEYNTSFSLSGSNLSIVDGGGTKTVSLSTLSDADGDPTNELQTLSKSGSTVTLSIGGGSVSINDADSNPSNELQTISKSGSTLTLSNGGGSVSVNDADSNPSNELQTISKSGLTVTLSNGGGSISVADNDNSSSNELQTLSISGNTLSISGRNSVAIPAGLPSGTSTYTMRHNGSTWVSNSIIRNNGSNAAIGGAVDNSYKLRVYGRIRSNGVNETSDARFKTNVNGVENALDKVLAMEGVTYDWKVAEYPDKGFETGKQIGVIAQEIEKILPEIVSTDGEGFKSVEYSHIVPVLIEAIKEQQAIINKLEAQNGSLSVSNSEMKARLDNLERSLSHLIYSMDEGDSLEFSTLKK